MGRRRCFVVRFDEFLFERQFLLLRLFVLVLRVVVFLRGRVLTRRPALVNGASDGDNFRRASSCSAQRYGVRAACS
ncbi:hypothetical protein ACWDYJ_31175 [Streptomyces sp. NPDC003042]